MGNLTADPTLKTTQNGTAVATFAIATNRSYTDSSGAKQDAADFHNIVAFGKLGEICTNLLKVGSKVMVEGRLQTRKWEGQDGKTNYRTEVVIDEMQLIANGRAREEGEYTPSSHEEEAPKAKKEVEKEEKETKKSKQDEMDEINLDEIPF